MLAYLFGGADMGPWHIHAGRGVISWFLSDMAATIHIIHFGRVE